MPSVGVYGPRKVGTERLPGVRRQAAATPLSTGATLEQARGQKWDAVAQLAQTGTQAAIAGYSEMRRAQIQEQERADAIANLHARNDLSTWVNQTLYDPTTGVIPTRRGPEAFGLPESVGADYTKRVGELSKSLTTTKQRMHFEADQLRIRQTLDHTLYRHVYGEMQRYQADELQASTLNARDSAVAAASDPKADLTSIATEVGVMLTTAVDDIRLHAPQVGRTPAQIDHDISTLRTATHAGVVRALIAQDKSTAARTYYEATKDEITVGDERTRLAEQLDVATTAQAGLATSNEIWRTLGPTNDREPINFDQMYDAAAEKYKDDPKLLEATMRFLREKKSATDQARADRKDEQLGNAYLAASRGASLSQVVKMPEFLALAAGDQAKVITHVQSLSAQAASRAAAEEGRAYTREQRKYMQGQRAKAVQEEKNWARYWDLSEPARLVTLSDNALNALRGDIGDEHVNRLFAQKRTIGKTEQDVRAATIDDDLFKTTAQQAGLKPYGSLDDAQKAELGELRNAVETEIDRQQQARQKQGQKGVLTRDEKKKLMQDIIGQKVYTKSWWSDPERIAATITSPEDRAASYVPIAKIPPAVVTQYLNYVKSLKPEYATMPERELRSRFQDRMERAYAAASPAFHRSRAEILAILAGKED